MNDLNKYGQLIHAIIFGEQYDKSDPNAAEAFCVAFHLNPAIATKSKLIPDEVFYMSWLRTHYATIKLYADMRGLDVYDAGLGLYQSGIKIVARFGSENVN